MICAKQNRLFYDHQCYETNKCFPTLLKVIKNTKEYNDAAWLLQYQMESMLDIYKRLL